MPGKVADYKGYFYDNKEEKKFYEAGAHFSYKELYRLIEKMTVQPRSHSSLKPKAEQIVVRKTALSKQPINVKSSVLSKKTIDASSVTYLDK